MFWTSCPFKFYILLELDGVHTRLQKTYFIYLFILTDRTVSLVFNISVIAPPPPTHTHSNCNMSPAVSRLSWRWFDGCWWCNAPRGLQGAPPRPRDRVSRLVQQHSSETALNVIYFHSAGLFALIHSALIASRRCASAVDILEVFMITFFFFYGFGVKKTRFCKPNLPRETIKFGIESNDFLVCEIVDEQ